MPDWSRHLVFALGITAAVVGGAVALTVFGLLPLSETASTGGWIDLFLLSIVGV